jgi:uncharacterized membrane protein YbhN (UPF0104 family)
MSGIIDWITNALAPIGGVDPRWALLALLLQLGNLACRAVTWRNVLAAAYPEERLSPWRVGLAYAVGAGLNGYLPARGGDAVKVALVKLQLPRTSAIAVASSCSVLAMFDAVVGLSIMAAGWFGGAIPRPQHPPAVVSAVIGSPLYAGIAITVLVAVLWFAAHHLGPRARRAVGEIGHGIAVLRTPIRYARTVLSFQTCAWLCRIGVVFCMLSAFGIPSTPVLAALVVVVGGMSTLVPVPGGVGTQQALAVFVLSTVTSASTALGYSIGAQVGITLVNTTIATIAAMLIFGRLHPVRAIREAMAHASMRPAVEPTS